MVNVRKDGLPIDLKGNATVKNAAQAAPDGVMNAVKLPSFVLHGFKVPERLFPSQDMLTDLSILDILPFLSTGQEQELKKLDPIRLNQYNANFFGEEGSPVQPYNVYKKVKELTAKGDRELADRLFNLDLMGNIDLTRFVVGVNWENTTKPPFGNGVVRLKMPAILANYLLHGSYADIEWKTSPKKTIAISQTDGFKHIQAGGWCSIRFNYEWQEQLIEFGSATIDLSGNDTYRTAFFGKIVDITMETTTASNGGQYTIIDLTLSTFLQPYFVGEHRKTSNTLLSDLNIDHAAMTIDGSATRTNAAGAEVPVSTSQVITDLVNRVSQAHTTDVIEMLAIVLQAFGHAELPTTLVQDEKNIATIVNKPRRLGDNIIVMGGDPSSTVGTPYTLASSMIDSINNSNILMSPKYFIPALIGVNQTLWGMITAMFQNDEDLVELFPVLIPLPHDYAQTRYDDAMRTGQTESIPSTPKSTAVKNPYDMLEVEAHYEEQSKSKVKEGFDADNSIFTLADKTALAGALNAVPALVYRLKPLQPDFDGSKEALEEKYPTALLDAESSFFSQYFGKRDNFTDLKTQKGSRYLEINADYIVSQRLTWSERDRVNFVHIAPNEINIGVGEAFGVECVPVANVVDINRNGLRVALRNAPFTSVVNKGQAVNNQLSLSAYAERLYYIVGEGHAYARGQIVCTYLPNPNIVAGLWVRFNYSEPQDGTDYTYFRQKRGLCGYITAVSHILEMDQRTGQPKGTTILTIERASYGGRICRPTLKAVPISAKVARPSEDESRQKVRPKTIPSTEPARPVPSQEPTLGQPTGGNTIAAPQDSAAPQASRKGGDSASPEARATGLDPNRRGKRVSKAPKGYTQTDPTVAGPKDKKQDGQSVVSPTRGTRQKATPTTAAQDLYRGAYPPSGDLYSALWHYDDKDILPLTSIREFDVSGNPLGADQYFPTGAGATRGYVSEYFSYEKWGEEEQWQIDYADGATGFVRPERVNGRPTGKWLRVAFVRRNGVNIVWDRTGTVANIFTRPASYYGQE